MKARYDKQTNTLTDISSIETPPIALNKFSEGTTEYFATKIRWEEYNEHVSKLRTIPCDLSCRDKFVDKGVYEEGEHYVLQEQPIPYFEHIDDPVEFRTVAIPLSPPVQEDELWEEVAHFLKTKTDFRNDYIQIAIINPMKSKYSITKKQ